MGTTDLASIVPPPVPDPKREPVGRAVGQRLQNRLLPGASVRLFFRPEPSAPVQDPGLWHLYRRFFEKP
jgi:hypothetical protein